MVTDQILCPRRAGEETRSAALYFLIMAFIHHDCSM